MTGSYNFFPSTSKSLYQNVCPSCRRSFGVYSILRSGHNRWSKIKHDKAVFDSRKSRARMAVSEEITNASKFLGPDPQSNNRLALAILNAKRTGMTKSTIETAIARGQGRSLSGKALETVTVEGLAGQIALIVECVTDNKARALADIRLVLKEYGAVQTPTMYLFERRGRVVFRLKDADENTEEWEEKVLDAIMDEEIFDVVETFDDGQRLIAVDTIPAAMKEVEIKVGQSLGLELNSSETIWVANPDTKVREIREEEMEVFIKLHDTLQEYQGMQGVYTNIDESLIAASPDTQEQNTTS